MAGKGALSKGGIFSTVWRFLLLTALFALIAGAGQKGFSISVSDGFNDETRGVVIVFAKNSQLNAVLTSMSQIRGAYDNTFSKDWIFYSDEIISDEFKALTSNLTQPGRAYYENRNRGSKAWDLPSFARHYRLRGYNWAWKITPGVSVHMLSSLFDDAYTHEFEIPPSTGFDVFEAMKSLGMIYGSSTFGSQAVQPGFANVGSNAQGPPRGVLEVQWSSGANGEGENAAMRGKVYSDAYAPAWLGLVYELCSFGAGFEIGWLDLFRNAAYLKAADFISNTLVMPASSLQRPDPYFDPEPVYGGFGADIEPLDLSFFNPDNVASSASVEVVKKSGVFYLVNDFVGDIPEYHQHWIKVADDFDEQRKMPGIRAGRTSLYWQSKFYTANKPAFMKRSVRLPIWDLRLRLA